MVLDGKISIYSGDVEESGLKKYLFSREEVISNLSIERQGIYNRKETASALNTDPNNIVNWIKLGFLEGDAQKYNVVVNAEAVKRFTDQYIVLGEIARMLKLHYRWALNI